MFSEQHPQRITKSLEILGLCNVDNPAYVLDEIVKYIFDVYGKGNGKKEKQFDINYDYKYYWVDFLKFNINLNKQDIDWWEFNRILDSLFLDETSNMYQVMKYRCYEKPPKNEKTREQKQHQNMMKMKNKYSLPVKSEYGISKLWNYLESKVGGKKE